MGVQAGRQAGRQAGKQTNKSERQKRERTLNTALAYSDKYPPASQSVGLSRAKLAKIDKWS